MSLERFADLVVERPVPLGEAALVAARVLGHPAPVEDGCRRLAELATGVEGDDLDAVCRHLFGTCGFQGNRMRYYDAANSLLPEVLSGRRGIPVTLGILVVDVARRLGVDASLACMPGHVLIVDGARPGRWLDPFAGGISLDARGAEERFRSVHGGRAAFSAEFLATTPDDLVLGRLLGNLVAIFGGLGDARHLLRVHQLRYSIAPLADAERPALADALEVVGRYDEAGALWEQEAERCTGEAARTAASRARAARAHLN